MRRNLLIIFGLALLVIITGLGLYAYQINNIPVNSIPAKKTIEKEKTLSITEIKKAEEIKKNIRRGVINNQSFQTLEVEEEDCDEEAKNYSEELLTGTAKTAEGRVLAINSSSFKIEFTQGAYRWISEVLINSGTQISIVNSSTESQEISFSAIKIGDKLIVTSKDNKIVDTNFTAESLFIL